MTTLQFHQIELLSRKRALYAIKLNGHFQFRPRRPLSAGVEPLEHMEHCFFNLCFCLLSPVLMLFFFLPHF